MILGNKQECGAARRKADEKNSEGDGLDGWGGGSNLCISKSDMLNFIPPEQDLGVDRTPETFVRSALEHL